MPARLAAAPHPPDWYFGQSAAALRAFPLDHNLWRVPMDLLKLIPPDKVPAGVAEQALADVRARDPYYFLFRNADSPSQQPSD